VYFKIKVHADAKEDKLERLAADSYRIWVRSPAEAGRANRAALQMLAEDLGKPAGLLRIVKGAHAPAKIIELREV